MERSSIHREFDTETLSRKYSRDVTMGVVESSKL